MTTAQNAMLFNSLVLGLHNYFNRATHVNLAFSRLAYEIGASMYNRLKPVGKYEPPNNPPPVYKKFYGLKPSLDGTRNAWKLARSVWSRGKAGDNFKCLPTNVMLKKD